MTILPQGTVIHVVWPHSAGGEKSRFAVVVGDANGCPPTEDLILVKLTSTPHEDAIELSGDARVGTQLSHDTYIHTWSVNTIHLDYINQRKGRLPEFVLREVLKRLSKHLGIA